MEYTPISSFRQPITRDQLQSDTVQAPDVLPDSVNKWTVLRELSKAQSAFDVTERDLTVLQGLLSFFPGEMLSGDANMVVFASNKTICERLNGMPCSTMRRHLARLVDAGLITRRDSPNGKRYTRKNGSERIAFGLELTPLYTRFEEIARKAELQRSQEQRVRSLREVVSLMRRDLLALAAVGRDSLPGNSCWDRIEEAAEQVARALRRKLSAEALETFQADLSNKIKIAKLQFNAETSAILSTNDARVEQHYHTSKKDLCESELSTGQSISDVDEPSWSAESPITKADTRISYTPKIPLHLVLKSCPSLADFDDREIRHWHQLHAAACNVRPAMGICASAWEDAERVLGPEHAAIVLVAMLERFAEIRSPGGYLRALTKKAASGSFSCGPMIMALFSRQVAA